LRDALLHPGHYGIHTLAGKNIRERERQIPAHFAGIPIHDGQIRAHMWSQVHLVDDEKIGSSDPWSTFSWDLVTTGHINYIDDVIDELRAKGRSQVVAPAFQKDQFNVRMATKQIVNGFLVMRGIFPNRRMWTPSSFNTKNPVDRQGTALGQDFCVDFRENIVCHGGKAESIAQPLTQRFDKRCLP
jgi:hypothetical protein